MPPGYVLFMSSFTTTTPARRAMTSRSLVSLSERTVDDHPPACEPLHRVHYARHTDVRACSDSSDGLCLCFRRRLAPLFFCPHPTPSHCCLPLFPSRFTRIIAGWIPFPRPRPPPCLERDPPPAFIRAAGSVDVEPSTPFVPVPPSAVRPFACPPSFSSSACGCFVSVSVSPLCRVLLSFVSFAPPSFPADVECTYMYS
ncbi:hypothetical protein PYCCODRAFT_746229 [Trametes coccinea BRFM310]|uniref:Uncharacterized protein n=1 Tax=Trametes coccinea (strain BRFM310) TaxID=1353009 RepID=A0A1Y2IH49_TRAC3|nr:hypothetical protein PYCCODRAFT_746229 [Trametes coccinea BRFM310]